jgi:hypothetical protein
MPQFLLIVGALLVLAGMGSIAAGAPDWVLGLSLGATLIQSGTIALVGGLILVALGMVLYVMQDLLRRIDAVVPANPGRAIGAPRERAVLPRQPAAELPPPKPDHPEEPAAEESLRPPREAPPQGEQPRPRRERPREPMPEENARARRPNPAAQPGEEQPRPRRDLPAPPQPEEAPPRTRAVRTLEQASEDLARMRSEYAAAGKREAEALPARRTPGPIPTLPQPFSKDQRRRPPESAPAPEAPENYVPKFRPAEAPQPAPAQAPQNPGSDTVVRSGVIGGMAYTLYTDGSIEAELGIGTVRFNSIADLQDHVTRTGEEADVDFDESRR